MPSGDELRRAMRRFPSGIAVTVVDDGRKLGLAVGSLVSLSLELPASGSIGLDSSLDAPLRRVGRFVATLES